MCHFITLVAPTDDQAAVEAVMRRHERRAMPIDNPSLAKVMQPVERQYLTTSGHCDCGTVLAGYTETTPEEVEARLVADSRKLRRKGWSDAKITRWMDDRRPKQLRSGGGIDSLGMWRAVLQDLMRERQLPYAGLFVRTYCGAIATEDFKARRRELPRGADLEAGLEGIREDELLIFRPA